MLVWSGAAVGATAIPASPVVAEASLPAGAGATGRAAARALEQPLLDAINRVRRAHGLAPLRPFDALERAARSHSSAMARQGFFAHSSPDGASVRERIGRFVRSVREGGGIVGEVLLWRSPMPSPEEALRMWLQSPSHRAVLLDGRYRSAGVAAVFAGNAPGAFRGLDVTIVTVDLLG